MTLFKNYITSKKEQLPQSTPSQRIKTVCESAIFTFILFTVIVWALFMFSFAIPSESSAKASFISLLFPLSIILIKSQVGLFVASALLALMNRNENLTHTNLKLQRLILALCFIGQWFFLGTSETLSAIGLIPYMVYTFLVLIFIQTEVNQLNLSH